MHPANSWRDWIKVKKNDHILAYQAGFREGYSYTAQVSSLPPSQKRDFYKFLNTKKREKILTKLLNNMMSDRHFQGVMGDQFLYLNNGLPQGVLALVFFNIYKADIPETTSKELAYGDENNDKLHGTNSKQLNPVPEY